MKRVCVFCGSSAGVRPEYLSAARAMGALLARRGLELVYGGGDLGLMGATASAAVSAGGAVIGVIPRSLLSKVGTVEGVELRVVETMHQRKAAMFELADGFVALPGGIGTFEEILEMLTWAQLRLHAKPCALLDVRGYWSALVGMVKHATAEGFIRPRHQGMLLVSSAAEDLLAQMEDYRPPAGDKFAEAVEG